MKWFKTSEQLPPIDKWVLVPTGEPQNPYEIMKFCGVTIGRCWRVGGDELEFEHPYWINNHGGVLDHHPYAWGLPPEIPWEIESGARHYKGPREDPDYPFGEKYVSIQRRWITHD